MISRTSLQTLKAMAELAKLPPGQHDGAVAIARRIKAPGNYLGKALQNMVEHGLVTSRKGQGGGFCLSKAARDITLFEIVDAIEDLGRWEGCFLNSGSCGKRKTCALHDRWATVRGGYLRFLKKTRLTDLI